MTHIFLFLIFFIAQFKPIELALISFPRLLKDRHFFCRPLSFTLNFLVLIYIVCLIGFFLIEDLRPSRYCELTAFWEDWWQSLKTPRNSCTITK